MKRAKLLSMLLISASLVLWGLQGEAAFYPLGGGARVTGMGEAFVGVSGGLDSFYWNPSGLISLKNTEVCFTQAQIPGDFSFSYVSIGLPLNEKFKLAGSFSLLGSSDDFLYREGIVTLGGAYPISPKLIVGGSFKQFRLDSVADGSGIGFDFGGLIKIAPRLTLGLAIHDFNSKISYSTQTTQVQPVIFTGGLAYSFGTNDYFAVDVDSEKTFKVGVEKQFNEIISFRGGINNGQLTGGLTIKKDKWQIDYAYLNKELGEEQRVSVKWLF